MKDKLLMLKGIQLLKRHKRFDFFNNLQPEHFVHIAFSVAVSITSMLLYNRHLIFSSAAIIAFLFMLFLVLAFSRNRWIFIFAFPVLIVPGALLGYFIEDSRISLNENIVSALINTNYAETMELVSMGLVQTLVLALLYCGASSVLLFYLHRRFQPKSNFLVDLFYLGSGLSLLLFVANGPDFFDRLSWLMFFFVSLAVVHFKEASWPANAATVRNFGRFALYTVLISLGVVYSAEVSSARPFNLNREIAAYYLEFLSLEKNSSEKLDLATLKSSFDEERGKDLNVVLIIGESARSDHFYLNGYKRNTNPRLSKRGDIISFTEARTRSTCTRIAVPNIVTRSRTTKLKGIRNETSIISIFNKHGFFTGWISSNEPFGEHASSTTCFAKEATYLNFRANARESYRESNDGPLLPVFRRVIEDHSDEKLFLVLHTRGSHWRYDLRYPKEFEVFKPVSQTSNSASKWKRNELINAYDNSILYTDYFIDKVIEELEDRNALVLYVSDHGESLGEDGHHGHSNNKRGEQKQVPMILWGSKTFRSRYHRELAAFLKYQHTRIRHEIVFHTLLGLTGFKSKAISSKLNLAR